jgi:hypothetical protein
MPERLPVEQPAVEVHAEVRQRNSFTPPPPPTVTWISLSASAA